MNRKAEIGPIGAIISFLVFIINWFVWMGQWVAERGQAAIDLNGITGIEAFFLANLNFIILICVILAMLGWMYISSE